MSLSLSHTLKSTAGQMLPALQAILKKTAVHAAAKNIEEDVFLNARLAPDMFPLARQIQIASDLYARGAARLAGKDVPSFPDTEKSISELIERIQKAHDLVQSESAADIDAGATRTVTVPTGRETSTTMEGSAYLLHFVLPNVYFHITCAYAILRHNGVDIGKRDYLGAK